LGFKKARRKKVGGMKCNEYNQYNENGLPEGIWREYYDISKKEVFLETTFSNGVPHGLCKIYYMDGVEDCRVLQQENVVEGEEINFRWW